MTRLNMLRVPGSVTPQDEPVPAKDVALIALAFAVTMALIAFVLFAR